MKLIDNGRYDTFSPDIGHYWAEFSNQIFVCLFIYLFFVLALIMDLFYIYGDRLDLNIVAISIWLLFALDIW